MASATASTGAHDSSFGPEEAPDRNHMGTMRVGREAVDSLEARLDDTFGTRLNLMDIVRAVGGAMIGIAILVVVLNEVFDIDSINNSSGEFSGVIDSLTSTGGAALGLLVIGLLVVAANRIMSFFGGGGF